MMQTLGRFCLLVVVDHSLLRLYQNFLRRSLRFMDFPSTFNFLSQASELGCGFVLLGYFSRLFNFIGLALIFAFCLRILRFTEKPRFISNPKKVQELETNLNFKSNAKNDDAIVSSSEDENLEDEVFDVMSLRNLVKIERQRFNAACAEIDKERTAASTAAEEAMAMILRLQSEKSAVEIQANQFRRMVEERQEYDLEVIESLSWDVVQLESQKSLLEEQLDIYREKLRVFMKDDEIEFRGCVKDDENEVRGCMKEDEIEQLDEEGTVVVADDSKGTEEIELRGCMRDDEIEMRGCMKDDEVELRGCMKEDEIEQFDEGGTVAADDDCDDKGTEEESVVAADDDCDDKGTEKEESDVADDDCDDKGTEEESDDAADKGTEEESAVAVAVAAVDDKGTGEESDVATKEFCNFEVELDVEIDVEEEVASLEKVATIEESHSD